MEAPEYDHVALLTDQYFDHRFHRDPAALGKSIILGGAAYTAAMCRCAGLRASIAPWLCGKSSSAQALRHLRFQRSNICLELIHKFPDRHSVNARNILTGTSEIVTRSRYRKTVTDFPQFDHGKTVR